LLMIVLVYLVVCLVLAGLLVVGVVHLVAAQRNEVPPVFTPTAALDEVVRELDLPERGVLIDLGCGEIGTGAAGEGAVGAG
jgi:hypothetical protein